MNRAQNLATLSSNSHFDILIIGGGATGLGSALDAASRGLKTLLIERADFSKGTSSRSTKLVHGGVRYLAQGNIKLVREALRERGLLLKNAPHLCHTQSFIIPVYSWFDKIFYGVGLKIYDLLAGKLSLGATKILSKKQTLAAIPTLQAKNLVGGIRYFDGQFNDSRLCIDLATTAEENGAILLNYCEAIAFEKQHKKITAVVCKDRISGLEYTITTKSVINATGVFTDAILQMDDVSQGDIVTPSQGIHLVLRKDFFPSLEALMIPKTADGRVLFAVPWEGVVVLGTTDTPVEQVSEDPQPLEEEVDFILSHFNQYTTNNITRNDLLSTFTGLRPLVKGSGKEGTALLSRDHTILVSSSGLVTITGGKWTTYRNMAEDAVNNAVFSSKQKAGPCITKELPIGKPKERQKAIEALMEEDPSLAQLLHPDYTYTYAELVYAIRFEMAMTVEDLLSRRTRLNILDAKAATALMPAVASLLAKECRNEKLGFIS